MLTSATRSWIWITTALTVMAGCNSELPSEPDGLAQTNEPGVSLRVTSSGPQPWRIQATVATTPASAPAGCLVYFTSTIEGHATHVGAFSGVGSTCVTGVIQPDPDPPFVPAGPAPYFTADFTNPLWTLTASNGDEVWLEGYDAVAVISLVDGSLRGEGRMRIVGGTGRFAGATGDAVVGAVNDDGQGPDDFSGSGWIDYRAADRATH